MSLSHIDAERILDLISGTIDGGWNDGVDAFVEVEVDDGEGNKKKFTLTIEES